MLAGHAKRRGLKQDLHRANRVSIQPIHQHGVQCRSLIDDIRLTYAESMFTSGPCLVEACPVAVDDGSPAARGATRLLSRPEPEVYGFGAH